MARATARTSTEGFAAAALREPGLDGPVPNEPVLNEPVLNEPVLNETERRCIVTGEVLPKCRLLRFVVDPAGRVLPDIAGRLPGRGLWLTARRDIVAMAVGKKHFARAARMSVSVDDGLADRVEALLAARCCDLLGLARRAGQAVNGFVKVRTLVAAGGAAVLVEAADGGTDGRGKLVALAPGLPLVDCLSCAELSAALGHEHVAHVALTPGRLAHGFVADAARLRGFRRPDSSRGPGEAGGTSRPEQAGPDQPA